MNELIYEIALESITEYSLEVMKRGCCPYVIKAVFYTEGECCKVKADVHGFFHLKTFLSSVERKRGRFDSSISLHKEVLGWLRKIIEALAASKEYLMTEDFVSFLLDDLYFESRQGRAVFLMKPSKGSSFEKLCRLCEEISEACPDSNADIIKTRLQLQNANSLLGLQDVLRFLSSWECEIA
ncbi:MAG: hypothetical protein EOM59_02805 [Clostridia bacterium]|nr:hypothetical protein [Clostridia bacterium]